MTTQVETIRAAQRADQLLAAFLSGKQESTAKSYRADLHHFATWSGHQRRGAVYAVTWLLTMSQVDREIAAGTWRDHQLKAGLAPNTINRRLAMLRSLTETARVLGYVEKAIKVKGVKARTYRDTRGPEEVREIIEAAAAQGGYKGPRDLLLVRLLFDMALRVNEALTLDLEHIDGKRLQVLRKGHRDRELRSMPMETREALAAWLSLRGPAQGPVFVSLTKAGTVRRPFRRLRYNNAYRAIRKIGAAAGVKVKPHGIRHASITRALELSGGDVRAVKQHSGHARVDTVLVYDDQRKDLAGFIASQVAASTTEEGAERMARELLAAAVKAGLVHLSADAIRSLVDELVEKEAKP